MPTQRKVETVGDLTDKMARMQLAVVADYRGLTVAELTELRRQLREKGAELIVAKNTLIKIAADSTGRGAIAPMLSGPTVVAFGYDDIAAVAKTLVDYSKLPNKKFTIKGAVLGTTAVAAENFEQVTKLPNRQQALAQVVGVIAAPASGVVGVINAAISNVAYVIQARIDQIQPAGEAA